MQVGKSTSILVVISILVLTIYSIQQQQDFALGLSYSNEINNSHTLIRHDTLQGDYFTPTTTLSPSEQQQVQQSVREIQLSIQQIEQRISQLPPEQQQVAVQSFQVLLQNVISQLPPEQQQLMIQLLRQVVRPTSPILQQVLPP